MSRTAWTERTELFIEYPALVAGRTSRFAVHVTRLDTFKAATDGRVDVRLSRGTEPTEAFSIDAPSRPGIFGVDVTPARPGSYQLTIALKHADLEDIHALGAVTVYADLAAARAAPPGEGPIESIRFLKEQQWALDFGTALVRPAALRESLRVPAVVTPRAGGSGDVASPIDGRLVRVADIVPGAAVTAGQELVRVQPSAPAPADGPQLRQMHAEATTAMQVATRDRERAERLVAAGAAPQRRLDEARANEEQARARTVAAEARLGQYQDARGAQASKTDEGLFVLRSPVAGIVAERQAITGTNISAGTVLFHVVDTRRVQVSGRVPESDMPRARHASAAEIEIPGLSERVSVPRVNGIGRLVDPHTRTVPFLVDLDNSGLGLAIGQTVFLHLLLNSTPPGPVVPISAVIDDGGQPIVFVQREGEAFDRRAVTLGSRSGDLVRVHAGVGLGERVVTRGGYLIRLASLSTQVPSHGHVH